MTKTGRSAKVANVRFPQHDRQVGSIASLRYLNQRTVDQHFLRAGVASFFTVCLGDRSPTVRRRATSAVPWGRSLPARFSLGTESGSQARLPAPSPLRTVHGSFDPHG